MKQQIDFRAGGNSETHLVSGWASPEGHGTWTDGPEGRVRFTGLPAEPLHVSIALGPFLAPPQVTHQDMVIMVNGQVSFGTRLDGGTTLALSVEPEQLLPGGVMELSFMCPDAVSPALLGLSHDGRRLGISVWQISLETAEAASESSAAPQPAFPVVHAAVPATPAPPASSLAAKESGMLKLAEDIVQETEEFAAAGGTLEQVLARLRVLDADNFGLLLLYMPSPRWPALSRLLPAAPTEEVDRHLTGDTGRSLLQKSARFVRSVAHRYLLHTSRPLNGARILDYGFGFGRLTRLMLRYSDPANIYGCDVAQRSLDWVAQNRLPGTYALIDESPAELPFGPVSFDLVYAFSVFTHLSEPVTLNALGLLSRSLAPGGLLVITLRPIEFWRAQNGLSDEERVTMANRYLSEGFAFRPMAAGWNFGETSITFEWVRQNAPYLDIVGYDWSPNDPYQVFLYLANNWRAPRAG